MPVYEFACATCSEENTEPYIFEVKQSLNEYTGCATCPQCNNESKQRIFNSFAIHHGLSAAEKSAGVTKKRFEMGKYMKNERTKRQKESEPGTRAHDSNELFVGNEVERGVISGPTNPVTKKVAGV